MPRRTYTPEEKARALAQLHINGGDIQLTSHQLAIPDRTLSRWGRQWYAEHWRRPSSAPPSPISFDDDDDALVYLRKQIMNELLHMVATFREDTLFAPPARRINLLSQLLDRLMKLDAHLKRHNSYEVQELMRVSGGAGLYLRMGENYCGPFYPQELPSDWKDRYVPSAHLEVYWGDDTFTPLPDKGDILEAIFDVHQFDAQPNIVAPPWEADEYTFG